jgi:hypothetical protein
MKSFSSCPCCPESLKDNATPKLQQGFQISVHISCVIKAVELLSHVLAGGPVNGPATIGLVTGCPPANLQNHVTAAYSLSFLHTLVCVEVLHLTPNTHFGHLLISVTTQVAGMM